MSTGNITAVCCGSCMIFISLQQVILEAIQAVELELILAVAIFVTIHSFRQRRLQGLTSWPLLGMLPSLLLGLRGDVYEWLTAVLVDRGGTFAFRGPSFTNLHCVITADPRNLQHILNSRFSTFPKGPYFASTVSDLLGAGIFASDDDTWRKQRKAASLAFHSPDFRDTTASSLVHLVHDRLLPVLHAAAAAATPLDLQDVVLRLTFDNVCMIVLGVDPGCLRRGSPEIEFAAAFEEATEATMRRFVTPSALWRAARALGVGREGRLRRSIGKVDEFAYQVIERRRRNGQVNGRPDLLGALIEEEEDDRRLRDACVNFILAGRDTSSVALTWFFWLLDQEMNRTVEEKIVEELRRTVRKRSGGGVYVDWTAVIFRPDEVKRMDYLHSALTEALRLYPSVPVGHKEAMEDGVFPDGRVVKKGTKVLYSMYSMGRMESIWGEDCREYKPDRWLRDGRFTPEPAYKFPAFNAGPRTCLGKDLAYFQMKFVASAVLLRYRVRVRIPAGRLPPAPKLALTLYMKHGLQVQLIPRQQQSFVT